MGWLWMHKPKGMKVADFLINYSGALRWTDSPCTYRVLDHSIVGLKTFYAAVEQVHKETGERRVWAAVFLLGYCPKSEHNFGYKDMDESMGPWETECPERILDLLTPTESGYANDWRTRCRAYHAARRARPKIEVGDTLKYGGRAYKVGSRAGRSWLIYDADGLRYRMTDARARRAEILKKESSHAV